MPDVCNQNGVMAISPELYHIVKKHNNQDYMMSWFFGLMFRYKLKKDSADAIYERYTKIPQSNIAFGKRNFADDPKGLAGYTKANNKLMDGAMSFLLDFDKLSHWDIHQLMQITSQEAGSRIISTIGGLPIELEV